MGERIRGLLAAHPGAVLAVLAAVGLICLRERRIIGETMAVIAVVAAAAASCGAAAVIAVAALRWARYARDRRNGAPGPEGYAGADDGADGAGPAPVDWEAEFARLDERNGS
jgi:hypothetical protein